MEVKHFSNDIYVEKTCQNFAIFLVLVAKQQLERVDIGDKKKRKKFLIDKQELSIQETQIW